jgi:AraC family transcriptional regulator of adaptative response / DNA-3-methyladenine glycosylase II
LCRPDRLPGLGLEPPASEVAHALRLVTDGFLDTASTDELAARIGYSTRHLVRLFEKHVGASPDFVARARRAHLARRLLDESRLSVTNVAFAAGFSSIRQMNRVMKDLFGFSPSALRGKRTRGEPLSAIDGGLRLRVPYHGRLEAMRLIAYLGARATSGVELVKDGRYLRTMNTCGYPGVVEVGDAGDGAHLEATMHLATFGSIIEQVERVRALFGLDRDPADGVRHLRRDALLRPLVLGRPGLRIPGAFDRFETAIRIIVGQQVSVAGASTTLGRIVQRVGEPIAAPLPGGLRFLFPSPDALARADVAELGMPRARAGTVVGFARAVASGDVDLGAVLPLPEALLRLQAVPGVGPWTAHLIAARVMGADDAFPASDLGLRRAAGRLVGADKPIATTELEALAQRWRPHRALAAVHLWMSETTP